MKKYALVLPMLLSVIVLTAFQSKSTKSLTKNITDISNYENTSDMDGKTIFMSKGCALCHHLQEEKMGPSVKDIAKAYAGKKDDLIKFFKREGKPIVAPEDFAVMSANLFATKRMKDEALSALADFILSVK